MGVINNEVSIKGSKKRDSVGRQLLHIYVCNRRFMCF